MSHEAATGTLSINAAGSPASGAVHEAPRVTPGIVGVSLGGVAWNLFGVAQFVQSLRSTPESLVQMGMTPAQAAVYSSYPAWMTVAFGIGVGGGLAGSALLLARRALAVPVLAASLGGYLVLYAGDIVEGSSPRSARRRSRF